MSAAEDFVGDFLAHHGVKGMKWGVRRRERTEAFRSARKAELGKGGHNPYFRVGLRPKDYGDVARANRAGRAAAKEVKTRQKAERRAARAGKKIARGDKVFDRSARSIGMYFKLQNNAADHFNHGVGSINRKPEYVRAAKRGELVDSRFTRDKEIYKRYHKEVSDLYLDGLRQAAAAEGTNPSGTKRINVRTTDKPYEYDIVLEDVTHATDLAFKIIFEHDDKGLITGVSLNEMTQGMNVVEDILEHHGVKGMKWGVRKNYSVGAGGTRTKVKTRKLRKTKVKVRGGRAQTAHPEAVTAREAQRVLKKSGVNALSNKDLQMLQTRLNLEQNVSRLSKSKRMKEGEQFVMDQLKKSGKKAAKAAAVAA